LGTHHSFFEFVQPSARRTEILERLVTMHYFEPVQLASLTQEQLLGVGFNPNEVEQILRVVGELQPHKARSEHPLEPTNGLELYLTDRCEKRFPHLLGSLHLFRKVKVETKTTFAQLTPDDLTKMNITKLGDRMAIGKIIEELRAELGLDLP